MANGFRLRGSERTAAYPRHSGRRGSKGKQPATKAARPAASAGRAVHGNAVGAEGQRHVPPRARTRLAGPTRAPRVCPHAAQQAPRDATRGPSDSGDAGPSRRTPVPAPCPVLGPRKASREDVPLHKALRHAAVTGRLSPSHGVREPRTRAVPPPARRVSLPTGTRHRVWHGAAPTPHVPACRQAWSRHPCPAAA